MRVRPRLLHKDAAPGARAVHAVPPVIRLDARILRQQPEHALPPRPPHGLLDLFRAPVERRRRVRLGPELPELGLHVWPDCAVVVSLDHPPGVPRVMARHGAPLAPRALHEVRPELVDPRGDARPAVHARRRVVREPVVGVVELLAVSEPRPFVRVGRAIGVGLLRHVLEERLAPGFGDVDVVLWNLPPRRYPRDRVTDPLAALGPRRKRVGRAFSRWRAVSHARSHARRRVSVLVVPPPIGRVPVKLVLHAHVLIPHIRTRVPLDVRPDVRHGGSPARVLAVSIAESISGPREFATGWKN